MKFALDGLVCRPSLRRYTNPLWQVKELIFVISKKFEDRSFLFLLLLVTIAFGLLMKPFFSAILWAVLLAIIFAPIQQRLERSFPKRSNLAALLILISIVLIVIIPLSIIASMLAKEGALLYQRVSSGEINVQLWIDKARESQPFITKLAERFNIDLADLKQQLSTAAVAASKYLATQAFSIGQGYVQFALSFVIMLYLTFFFLRDGRKLTQLIIHALPLGNERELLLFRKFAEVARATVKGNLLVAIAQGSLGGFIFWVLGIQGVVLWAVVMTILSLLPAVGSALVWVPAAIYLLVMGHMWQGIILILFGTFVIGLIDNILRPILVGRDTKLPDYLVLLSTLGGIALFGLNGFVVGPVIAALFLAFWQIFMQEFNPS